MAVIGKGFRIDQIGSKVSSSDRSGGVTAISVNNSGKAVARLRHPGAKRDLGL